VLINAPYVDSYGAVRNAVGRYFPLGLGYIAAVLRRDGHQVLLLDPEAQTMQLADIDRVIMNSQPELVGISSATPNFPGAVELCRRIKKLNNCAVIVGGVHASAMPLEILENVEAFDYVAVGEGEYLMSELATCIEKGDREGIKGIDGLAYRDEGYGPMFKGRRPAIGDLDELPMPARDLVDMSLYRPHAHNYRHKRSATMLTSRGCPARCSFCASHVVHGRRFRAHSPRRVLDEVEELYYKYKIRHILIQDDTFTVNKARVHEICDLIIASNMQLSWFCFARANTVDEELLKKMKRAGCYSIGFGVESGSNDLLRSIEKGLTIEVIQRSVMLANKLGFKTQTFFIFGHPQETVSQAKATIKAALSLNSQLAFFNIMIPFPGTDIFEALPDKVAITAELGNFVAVGTKPIDGISNLSSAQISAFVKEANIRYYFRVSQIVRMIMGVSGLNELREYIRGLVALVRQVSRIGKS
jgi:radical SAM superfamily enzyme YgiQ (UPF0313 family)